MEMIGPGFGNDADDSARIAAIFSRVVAGKNSKLLHRVRIGSKDHAVADQVVVDTAIQKKSHGIRTRTGDVKGARA